MMTTEAFTLDEALAVLRRTPATLHALLEELPGAWVRATEGEKTWSPYDVVGHLIHGERTDWIPRMRHILAGKTEPFEPFDRTAQFSAGRGKSLQELLETFAGLRMRNLDEVVRLNLTEQDLGRQGLHPELGKVTLRQLLATWVVHDLDHMAQIARTMAKMYAESTGPWRAYLSVLEDRRRS